MLRRFAKPFAVWSIAAVAAVAQQPGNNQQYGTKQDSNPPTSNQQFGTGRPAQATNQQQLAPQQAGTQQQSLQQQGMQQQPAQRTASTMNNAGNVPVGANQAQSAPGQATDRDALARQLEQQLAMQQAELAERLSKMPFEPLNAAQQDYLDKVLNVWEMNTAKIQRYKCNFKRWVFDPTQNTGNDPTARGEGAIRFMQPDKGLYRVDKLEFFAGRDDKQAPIYRENERQKLGEYWLCDGEYVHILDRNDKKCLKVELPPEMRGNQIHLSPLPFLFGVKAQEIKERYWVRPIAPPAGSRDVVLETFPKRPDDAGNYSRVQIVLDATDVLPKTLVVFMPNFRPDQPHREVYEFTERDKDWNMLDQMKDKLFREEFIPKTLPKDWEIVVEPYLAPQANGQPVAGNQPGMQPAMQPNAQLGAQQQPGTQQLAPQQRNAAQPAQQRFK